MRRGDLGGLEWEQVQEVEGMTVPLRVEVLQEEEGSVASRKSSCVDQSEEVQGEVEGSFAELSKLLLQHEGIPVACLKFQGSHVLTSLVEAEQMPLFELGAIHTLEVLEATGSQQEQQSLAVEKKAIQVVAVVVAVVDMEEVLAGEGESLQVDRISLGWTFWCLVIKLMLKGYQKIVFKECLKRGILQDIRLQDGIRFKLRHAIEGRGEGQQVRYQHNMR